ncbi:M23 family metallopeptidase [Silvimonas sp. JCM 19000]
MTKNKEIFVSWQRLMVPALLSTLLAACASTPDAPAPIVDRNQSAAAAPAASAAPIRSASTAAADSGAPGGTYVVKKGDTLYRIALDHGVAYRDLAAWNNLQDINGIKVGQTLKLSASGAPGATPPGDDNAPAGVEVHALKQDVAVAAAPAGGNGAITSSPAANQVTPAIATNAHYPKAVKLPFSAQNASGIAAAADGPAVAPKPQNSNQSLPASTAIVAAPQAGGNVTNGNEKAPASAASAAVAGDAEVSDWLKPTAGNSDKPFSEESRGIDIAGKLGQSVVASASGKVVYAGSGLRGYGKMIIIKHNAEFLSAYAHNSKLLVKEGDIVKKGEKIAEMGNTDADRVELHFEIRRFGKPVDPAKYIH